jgi:hypothetical protein
MADQMGNASDSRWYLAPWSLDWLVVRWLDLSVRRDQVHERRSSIPFSHDKDVDGIVSDHELLISVVRSEFQSSNADAILLDGIMLRIEVESLVLGTPPSCCASECSSDNTTSSQLLPRSSEAVR